MGKKVAVDFDGVISVYEGWKGLGSFGPLVPGVVQELQEMRERGMTIIINTTRGQDINCVREYLRANGVPYDHINVNAPETAKNVSDRKIHADVYIDDRAIPFEGKWDGMADRVQRFLPWNKTSSKRPSFLEPILGYYPDQIAFFTPNARKTAAHWEEMGVHDWIIDEVEAIDEYNRQNFEVVLCFNHSILPNGLEFELISLLSGKTWQIPENSEDQVGLSHIGIHVDDAGMQLDDVVDEFLEEGFPLGALIRTIRHSCAPNFYRYAFVDTRKLGFITKLIERHKPD